MLFLAGGRVVLAEVVLLNIRGGFVEHLCRTQSVTRIIAMAVTISVTPMAATNHDLLLRNWPQGPYSQNFVSSKLMKEPDTQECQITLDRKGLSGTSTLFRNIH
jgi:hypothetical protein